MWCLLLHRLRGEGEQARRDGQALFDAFLHSLDDGLREMGVGDLSVGKKMRKLGEAFYGRAKAYDPALAARPDLAPLKALVGRTVFAEADDAARRPAGRLCRPACRRAGRPAAGRPAATADAAFAGGRRVSPAALVARPCACPRRSAGPST